MSFGLMMALFGVAIAAGFAGVGSAMGVGMLVRQLQEF